MCSEQFSQLACKALRYEVDLTPKPGLVDQANKGAHKDMDHALFLRSIAALAPYFEQYVALGRNCHDSELTGLFDQLRQAGLEAERAMFRATQGVNTHKGVNFSFALILGATGYYTKNFKQMKTLTAQDSEAICQLISQMAASQLSQDFKDLPYKKQLSYGEQLYIEHGLQGPRGEAIKGYPTLVLSALPYLRKQAQKTLDTEYLQLRLLVELMTFVEDGNLIHRGGIDAWETVKAEAKQLQLVPDKASLVKQLAIYNDELVSRYLSPGGSADLLALTLYFAFLENIL